MHISCLLISMELILTPNCSLLYLHSNNMDSFKLCSGKISYSYKYNSYKNPQITHCDIGKNIYTNYFKSPLHISTHALYWLLLTGPMQTIIEYYYTKAHTPYFIDVINCSHRYYKCIGTVKTIKVQYLILLGKALLL